MLRLVAVKVLLLIVAPHFGQCNLRCFDCTSEINEHRYEYDACFYGDERYLPMVLCPEPSVCAAYHYQTEIPGSMTKWSVSRGCQAIRYGATCEDIFNDLRRTDSVLPGLHTCATCSTDLCNAAASPWNISAVLLWLCLAKILFIIY